MNDKGFTLWQLVAIMAVLVLPGLGLTIYGLMLAFKASIILGIVVVVVEPSPLVLGVLGLCGQPDVSEKIAHWLNLPV
jgi:hypothetical protein